MQAVILGILNQVILFPSRRQLALSTKEVSDSCPGYGSQPTHEGIAWRFATKLAHVSVDGAKHLLNYVHCIAVLQVRLFRPAAYGWPEDI